MIAPDAAVGACAGHGAAQQDEALTGFSLAFGEHPHPASPLALAVSSAAQHASALDRAGPPQHPASAFCEGARLVEHTPVSGRISRTSSAAASSPARCAAIERTCS